MSKRLPVAWLVIIDVLIIAGGAGAFYFWLALLPQPYQVVTEPTRPVHPTAPRVAELPATAPAVTPTTAPTDTPTSTASPTTAATATQPIATRQMAASAGVASPAVKATATATQRPSPTPRPTATLRPTQPPASPTPPAAPQAQAAGAELGNGKFADKFTNGGVERTDTSYRSANISVTLSKVQRKGVTYYVQDIYVRYIDNLRTAFARNTYGRAIAAWQIDIAKANNAIGSVNGDYYATGNLRLVIRNGKLYNARPEGDVAVLYYDGTMRNYAAKNFNAQEAMNAGAYQGWDFGPGLMTPEGKAIGVFNSGIAGYNPRTAFGYFEPGHYAFVVVDGRQPGYSNGMTLAQLAALFAELGCKQAYNLDGGQTSAMVFGRRVVNQPYRGGRPTSDIIFVGE